MKLSTSLSIVATLGIIASGVYTLDATYARDSKLCQVEKRLDRKILSDDQMNLQRRLWSLSDRYGEETAKKMPEYREIEQQRQTILRELER